MAHEKRYYRSPHLLIEWGDGNCLHVVQLMSSRRYRLDLMIVTLLNYLSQPRTRTELAEAVPALADQLPDVLAKLESAGLLQTEAPSVQESLWSPYELAMHVQASTGSARKPLPPWPAPNAHKEVTFTRRLPLSSQPNTISHRGKLSVAEALGQRRSIRDYGEEPLTGEELGVFLTTCARVFEFVGPSQSFRWWSS
jgi:hypothetical protein